MMNKKVIALVSVLAAFVSFAFAEKKMQYKVQSVVGKVTYQVSATEWASVTKDMELDENAVVSTALNSTLVVENEGKRVTVKPMKKGKMGELIALASTNGSVKIGSTVTKADVAADTTAKKGVATASSRASEAKEDVEWDE